MAFTPVDIPIVLDLATDFVTDFRETTNSNLLLVTDKIEDLLNNLEIDVTNLSIGTDTPINFIRTDNLIIEDTGFVFQTDAPAGIIARLSKNANSESVLNVDNLTVDLAITANGLTSTSLTVSDTITANGVSTFNAPVVANSGVSESAESVNVTLTDDTNIGTGTITLTSTSRQNIYVTLEADASVYTGGGMVGTISELKLIIDFDSAAPPTRNQVFTIHIVDVVEQGTGTSIVSDVNAQGGTGIQVVFEAGINQATANTILMHSDFVAQSKILAIDAGELVAYDSNVSFTYHIDGDTNDRLMIKSLVNIEVI